MLAYVFPGQGSQALGMLADIAAVYPTVQATYAEASAVLGYDLWALVQQGPVERLNQTEVTQPALLAASVALYRILQQQGAATPHYLAGHSLGEYSALVCSGVFTLAEGIALVAARGRFMQQAVPAGVGAMAAIIGLDDAAVIAACAEAAQGEVVAAVNFNAPGQVVIAGHAAAVQRAGEACKARGAKRALPLPVSVPSHCALMAPAAEQLADALQGCGLQTPQIPVVNNVDVAVEQDPQAIRHALVRQLYSPVRWTETIHWLAAQGVQEIVEVGPGKVLTGLNKRIAEGVAAEACYHLESLQQRIPA